ncbi:hypothetical protein FHY52_11400 [Nocardia nova]|nr:hypothetical protein [Nocardia nova]
MRRQRRILRRPHRQSVLRGGRQSFHLRLRSRRRADPSRRHPGRAGRVRRSPGGTRRTRPRDSVRLERRVPDGDAGAAVDVDADAARTGPAAALRRIRTRTPRASALPARPRVGAFAHLPAVSRATAREIHRS